MSTSEVARRGWTPRGVSWAGIASGPLAWAIALQANYTLASWPCSNAHGSTAWLSLAFILMSLSGGLASGEALRAAMTAPADAATKPRTAKFLALLGMGLAILFALGIAFQAGAGLIFNGCER